MRARRWFVSFLEDACEHMHWFTYRNPWLWLMDRLHVRNGWCLLAVWSDILDERWGTEVWKRSTESTTFMFRECGRCGTMRDETDLGLIGDDWYCHPSTSSGATCYQREVWENA